MDFLTSAEMARFKGVGRSSITNAKKRGIIEPEANGRYDPEKPCNAAYLMAQPNNERRNIYKTGKVEDAKRKKRARKKTKPVEPEEEIEEDLDEKEEESKGPGSFYNYDPTQKLYEDTRLKKTQADLKSLEYAQRLEVMVDRESLLQKFGAFYDFLLNDLICMPEEISDILWMRAKSAENPENILEEELKDRIEEIIKKAKAAAEQIIPPIDGIKYMMVESEDNDRNPDHDPKQLELSA